MPPVYVYRYIAKDCAHRRKMMKRKGENRARGKYRKRRSGSNSIWSVFWLVEGKSFSPWTPHFGHFLQSDEEGKSLSAAFGNFSISNNWAACVRINNFREFIFPNIFLNARRNWDGQLSAVLNGASQELSVSLWIKNFPENFLRCRERVVRCSLRMNCRFSPGKSFHFCWDKRLLGEMCVHHNKNVFGTEF